MRWLKQWDGQEFARFTRQRPILGTIAVALLMMIVCAVVLVTPIGYVLMGGVLIAVLNVLILRYPALARELPEGPVTVRGVLFEAVLFVGGSWLVSRVVASILRGA